MNYIYTDNRTNKKYVFNPMLLNGDKICLVSMSGAEEKFVAVSTLKRWYTKQVTESKIVKVCAFTGMPIGLFKVESASEADTMWVWTKNNKLLVFDIEGKQINAKDPKFANKIVDGFSFEQGTLDWALA